jgi:hypothetical protein
MNGPLVTQLVYASGARIKFDQLQLKDLLVKARKNNHALGLSGLLLYEAGSFLQVLEGPPAQVAMMFERIEKDPRHGRVIMLLKRQVAEPTFAEWQMGVLDANARVFGKTQGLSDFLQGGVVAMAETDRVGRFLDGFRSGIWRQFIH